MRSYIVYNSITLLFSRCTRMSTSRNEAVPQPTSVRGPLATRRTPLDAALEVTDQCRAKLASPTTAWSISIGGLPVAPRSQGGTPTSWPSGWPAHSGSPEAIHWPMVPLVASAPQTGRPLVSCWPHAPGMLRPRRRLRSGRRRS